MDILAGPAAVAGLGVVAVNPTSSFKWTMYFLVRLYNVISVYQHCIDYFLYNIIFLLLVRISNVVGWTGTNNIKSKKMTQGSEVSVLQRKR